MELTARLALPAWGGLDFLVLGLACLRLAYMLAREDGPFGVLFRLRRAPLVGGLFNCLYCVSVWVGFGMLLVYLFAPLLVWGLAISGLALAIRAYTGLGRGEG